MDIAVIMIVYIHGASATGSSFNYIREHLAYGNEYLVEYDSGHGFANNLELMKRQLRGPEKIFFVCHSLGGVYALHLYEALKKQVCGAVTISTPYGGAETADYAKYFLPFSKLLRDIGTKSLPIKHAQNITLECPWTNIVTTHGSCPWMLHENDGVVTVKSQKCRQDMELIELDTNHYEVVLSLETVNIIKDRMDVLK